MTSRKFNIIFLFALVINFSFVLHSSTAFGATVIFDFNDETLQGWTPKAPFGGVLGVNTGFGNPGGSMFTTDTDSSSGGLFVLAPSILSGDLSIYNGIQWDEYVPERASTTIATFIRLLGVDGTIYESDRTIELLSTWNTKFVSFDEPNSWTLATGSGNATFEDVISGVDSLYISLDTSTQSVGGIESWVDNVTVSSVPLPAALYLFGSGLLGLVGIARRKKTDFGPFGTGRICA
jgi:hypothetical protein